MAIPQLKHVQKVAGYGLLAGQGSSFGMLILKLKPWDERPDDADNVQSVIGQVYALTADIKDASVFAISPGKNSGLRYWVMRLSFTCRTRWAVISMSSSPLPQQYLGALNQRPEIAMAYSTFDVRYPQWTVEVDAAKCKRAGITPDAVLIRCPATTVVSMCPTSTVSLKCTAL
jgi:multidrug efflux pump subunit AcrB